MIDLLTAPEETAFRLEIRNFIAANLNVSTRDKVARGAPLERDDYMDWHRKLCAQNWIAPAWPTPHGGAGWNTRQRLIADEEMFRQHTPPLPGFGLKMIGPILIRYGSPAQQDRFLPRILSGEDWWCQGFSEPGAGSDLAGLRTRAKRVDGGWKVDGSKTWTTFAQYANWIFCLVRTDPDAKQQEGISMMLIPMDAPGVSRTPIRLMDGTDEVNQVFFDDVFVPHDMVVGEIDKGWTYAKVLLENERLGIGGIGRSKHMLNRVRDMIADAPDLPPDVIDRLTLIEIDILAMEASTLRLLSAQENGRPLGAETSLLKVRGTEIQQALTELALEIAGPMALTDGPADRAKDGLFDHVAYQFMNWRKLSIYGGSNEIQKNILAKQVLGL